MARGSKSDTPRTDAALIQRGLDPSSTAPFVKFVRELERELTAANRRLKEMQAPDGLCQYCGLKCGDACAEIGL